MVRRRSFLVEAFAGLNVAFLAVDIWVAHSVNDFRHWAEWIPFWFSILGALALLANLAVSAPLRSGARGFKEGLGLWVGVAVGVLSILVGVAGLLFHLQSDFFQVKTLRSLVYSAPFVAPLAFAGLGLLVLLNRTVPGGSREWGRWLLLLAWGGFVGNFVLSLVDHAQNGFFFAVEWVPVIVAGVVVGWLILPVFWRVPEAYLQGAGVLLLLAALVGVAGFVLHLVPVLTEPQGTLWGRLVYGAPPFAPLLFTDLAVLAGLAVWDLSAKGWVSDPARRVTP